MLRQFEDGLSQLRRSRNSLVPQWIAEWLVPEWSLVLLSALVQSWAIFSDHFSDWYDDPLKLSLVPGRILLERFRRPYAVASVSHIPPLMSSARRKQMAAVFFHGATLVFAPTAIYLCLAYLALCTPYKFVPALYAAWFVYSIDLPNTGSKSEFFRAMRRFPPYQHAIDYFPVSVVKTADLDPGRNYLFGSHPHGVVCFGAFMSFVVDNPQFRELFPGIFPRLLTLAQFYYLPLVRELLLAMGCCAASRRGVESLLSGPKGTAAVLVVGGAREVLNQPDPSQGNGEIRLILRERKGFVKLAMRHGADLVPTFSFGETSVFKFLPNPEGSFIRRFQVWFQRNFVYPPAIFYGRGLFQYNFGLIPFRRPINVVVGAPIPVPKVENPTDEEVDRVHATYVAALTKLYEDNVAEYGDAAQKLVIE